FRGNTLTKSNADAFGISFVQYERFEFGECPEDCGTDLIGIGVWDEWRFDFQIEYRGGGIVFLEPSDAEPGDYIAVGSVFKEKKPDDVTSVPESGTGVSLLGLGAVGLVGLLRKKLAS
ncbi:MAG: hypothetical protein LDL41_23780, partial [Coleofasciculus sp. S288]|nr:hypothetical protein [Coleofasciculus sp. S288]